jgi:NTP pyrophosphatase (non-canonical NTP hydrolase)
MKTSEYIKAAIKTESNDFEPIKNRLQNEQTIRLLHAGIGLSTESAEILDSLKKHIFYGKPLDEVNLKEEMGDLFWYLAIMADSLNIDFETIMSKNIEKLKARYGQKFSEEKAIERNLILERQTLE